MKLTAGNLASKPLVGRPLLPSSKSTQVIQRTATVPRANILDKLISLGGDKDVAIPSFRYDPSMQRWVKSNRPEGDIDVADTVIQPMSGPAYTVWPVMHAFLTAKKLKSVNEDEVRC
jgi:hypothetical protein